MKRHQTRRLGVSLLRPTILQPFANTNFEGAWGLVALMGGRRDVRLVEHLLFFFFSFFFFLSLSSSLWRLDRRVAPFKLRKTADPLSPRPSMRSYLVWPSPCQDRGQTENGKRHSSGSLITPARVERSSHRHGRKKNLLGN